MDGMNNLWAALATEIHDRPGTARHQRKRRKGRPQLPVAKSTKAKTRLCESDTVVQAHNGDNGATPWGLAPRQMQVLDMSVQGMDRTAIAAKLNLSLSTVTQHLTEVRRKIGVDTTAQAVVAWHRHYRVLGPKPAEYDKDNTLIANLQRALQAHRENKE